jgi:uncharacterized protein (TIRG00374 family)
MSKEQQSSDNERPTGNFWRGRANWLWQQVNNRVLRVALGTGFSLICLWLAFRDVSISQIVAAFGHVDWRLVALALGLVLMSHLARTARWKLLYHPDQKKLSFLRLAEVLFISQMLNIASPVRLGEVARIYFMGHLEARSRARTLGTIAVEKWLDILTLLILMLLVPVSVSLPAWFQDSKVSLAAIVIAFFGATLLLSFGKDRLFVFLESTLRFLPENWRARLRQTVDLTLSSLDVLRSPWVGVRLLGWSLLVWFLGVLVNYVVFLALSLSIPFAAALFLLIVLQVGAVVPSAPGELGIFNYLCVLAFETFSVGKGIALGYSVLLYLVAFGPILLLGASFLWWEGFRERQARPLTHE